MSPTNQKSDAKPVPSRSHLVKWIVAGLLLLFAAFIVMSLPRGFSDDLSHIGKGQAAIVLIRDKNAVRSYDLEEVMGSIRNNYTGRVEFLLIDADTQEGREFMAANHAAPVTLVLFNASGKLIEVLSPPQTAESMQQKITNTLGINP